MSNTEESKLQSEEQSQQQNEKEQKEDHEYQRLSSKKYLGLSNQGATCYMNSLLQSLFMTHQFRQKLYEWKYNPKKHNKEEDCLPLQLQILFSRLQLCTNRSFIDTKPLINTFGWTNSQMFQQQDVQEFCRVLFDAIEQSFDNNKESQWIRDLYEGQTENFVFCKQCKTDSIRNDNFLDLQLIIRSDFDDILNNSIEKCMKHFVKSVELQQDNQYFCEKCNQKVDAIKGVRFKALPPILMLQLNRFDLDYTTFQRKKICDRVYFPHILNMNEFFKKYEDIIVEDPPKLQETQEAEGYQSQKNRKILSTRKASFDEGQGQDCKPLFEDDFVSNKKYGSELGDKDKESQKETINFLEEEINKRCSKKESYQQQSEQPKMQANHPALITRADEYVQLDNLALFGDIPCIKQEEKHQKLIQQQKQEGFAKKNIKIGHGTKTSADEVYDLKTDGLQGFDENEEEGEDDFWSTSVPKVKQEEQMLNKFAEVNQKKESERTKQIINENIDINKQNQELISKYLVEGPYVYELYAVNVHSGGALGGHYFSYIKSFENGIWYNFNDSSVCKIRPSALDHVQGQENPKSNQNTSAYMLMYRQVGLDDLKEVSVPEVPQQIQKQLEEETEQEKKRIEQQKILQMQRERQINLKIYKNEEQSIQLTFDKYTNTLNDVKLKVMEQFEIKEDLSNWRLRAYSCYEKIMQETFSDQLDIPLVDLNLKDWKDITIEFKKEGEKFEEYDPSKININVYLWEPSIGMLENFGAKLSPNLKLLIRNTDTLQQFVDILVEKLSISQEEIIVLKKSNRSSNFKVMLLNDVQSTLSYTLQQLDVNNNSDIYVERLSDSREPQQLKTDINIKFAWEKQIEKESYSCIITFNDPKEVTKKTYSDQNLSITIDNRCTLRDAKNLIAKKIGMDVNKFIIKRNQLRNIPELKDLSIVLNTLNIKHRGSLFIAEGIPQSIDEYLIEYRICRKFETKNSLVANYETEHLTLMPTKTSLTVLELKQIIMQKLKELRNIDVKSPKCLRLQEKFGDYKTVLQNDKPFSFYQPYDSKVIGITILEKEEELKHDDILIYFKFWDWKSMELMNTVELVMKQYYDSQDFMHMVGVYFNIDPSDVEVYYIQSIKNLSLESISYELNNWKSQADQFSISLVPWFLSRDGETFIVRDKSLFSKNKSEIQSYLKGQVSDSMIGVDSKQRYVDPNASADNKGKLLYKPTETALKINLKKKVQETDEPNQAEENKENDQDNNTEKQEEQKLENEQEQELKTESNSQNAQNEQNTEKEIQTFSCEKEKNQNEDAELHKESNQNEGKSIQEASQPSDNPIIKTVRFEDASKSYFKEEDYDYDDDIMQQILLQSLQEYQKSNKQE
ncbi:ubiquitin carboxy-terminal hydrolase (macronuclear) [Tetrahymena thermophila SB210]|uniref:Ubiquitin carboxy-terminal hydrolase n=1 Tax=Tetrahymena thermophila (strain SB210) TaxID=312017 RepID=Q22VZ8_TETTS|nr:ubiquitin carboxy-terminal hydrolase [Tetrahymena thermophila SB210]EAR89618.2 ubiquitin carboxy-terminal hydrolase [Tetrahymena thermophila SB210]|eukprot:XP_001009864.2 ubiquitin carboxy-terminal hydrolase [Tetrahymena thermophila SB210]